MKEIKPDATLLVAVERSVTGASNHKIRCLLFEYELACCVGNESLAQSAELTLRRTLLHNPQLREPPSQTELGQEDTFGP